MSLYLKYIKKFDIFKYKKYQIFDIINLKMIEDICILKVKNISS